MYLEPVNVFSIVSVNVVSISFGDLMYLEHTVSFKTTLFCLVSISFGDLMYLEPEFGLGRNSHYTFQSPLEI